MFGAHSQGPWLGEAAQLPKCVWDTILDLAYDVGVDGRGCWIGRVASSVGVKLLYGLGNGEVNVGMWS